MPTLTHTITVAELITNARKLEYTMARISAACETTQNTVYNWHAGQRPQNEEFVRHALTKLIAADEMATANTDFVEFRRLITQLRSNHVQQTVIAKHFNVTRVTMQNWERGTQKPHNIKRMIVQLRELLDRR